jgi:hypothetical protein
MDTASRKHSHSGSLTPASSIKDEVRGQGGRSMGVKGHLKERTLS